MADAGPVWAGIAAKHGLAEAGLNKSGVALAHRSGSRARDRGRDRHDEEPAAGFHDYQPTLGSFLDLFARLKRERIIPGSGW